jgi:thiamine transporter ThiT
MKMNMKTKIQIVMVFSLALAVLALVGLFAVKDRDVQSAANALMAVAVLGSLISSALRSIAARVDEQQKSYDALKKQVDDSRLNDKRQT